MASNNWKQSIEFNNEQRILFICKSYCVLLVSWWRPCSCSSTPAERWRCQSPPVTSHKSRTGQVLAAQWNILFWNSPHKSTYPPSSYCKNGCNKGLIYRFIYVATKRFIQYIYLVHIFFAIETPKLYFQNLL